MSERGFRRLVLALLVFNTFIFCAIIGAGAVYLERGPVMSAQRLPLAGEELPKENRTAFRKALTDARRAARPTAQDARQARLEAAALMGQPTLDTSALADALKRARDAEYTVRATTEAKALDFVATLPFEERRRLAEGLIEREVPKPAAK